MTKINTTIGNTIEMVVTVDDLSSNPSEVFLKLYKNNSYENGLSDEIKTVTPTSINGEDIVFVFDTDDITMSPKTIFARFFVNDNSRKINAYMKIKFSF